MNRNLKLATFVITQTIRERGGHLFDHSPGKSGFPLAFHVSIQGFAASLKGD
ncbi:MAG: hypothetical protein OEZ45_00170 [Candidatus Aminicenantes bacterium]|nr:hypothetical protein [Candidatus Aminicenantes bacterium]